MLTDMVGYSERAHRDEAGALRAVRTQERLLRSIVPARGGRVVKSLGDGWLVEFASALEAVSSAVEIQRAMHLRPGEDSEGPGELRIGIHLGDVVRRGADVLGDAVNIAARIEPLSEPGGVLVSQQVFDQVRGKIPEPMIPVGSPKLKNIATPIPLYSIVLPSARARTPAPPPTAPRVAVLPLANISGRAEDEYFADGITEELIQTVARIGGLRVLARTSVMRYKRSEKAAGEIARELGATAIVEGGLRRAGDRVRVTARLLDPATAETLWSEEFDRTDRDVFALQSEIAQRIAESLEVEILRGERRAIDRPRPVDSAAHAAYLRGRQLLNLRTEESLRQSLLSFREALRRAPRFAQAYAGIADAWSTLAWLEFDRPRSAFPKARAAALRAVELEPELAEGHTALGFVRFLYDRAWSAAESEFRRALELNRNYPTAHQFYADLLKATGRLAAAESEVRQALALDPLSLAISTALGHVLYLSRRYDDAIAQYRRALDLDPAYVQAHLWFGRPYLALGKFREAIEEVETAVRLSRESTISLAVLGHVYASAGRTADATAILRRLRARSRTAYVPSYWVGLIHVGLRNVDRAFEWLGRAERERSAWLAWVNVEPRFDSLRGDPRFGRLLRRLHLA